MKVVNPFDTKLALPGIPEHIREAAVETVDTLDLCWAAVQAVFEDRAQPEQAVMLLPLLMARADEKHRQLLARFGRDTGGESKPPPAGL